MGVELLGINYVSALIMLWCATYGFYVHHIILVHAIYMCIHLWPWVEFQSDNSQIKWKHMLPRIHTHRMLIMPPGTVVPMGVYCSYYVRTYICMYSCIQYNAIQILFAASKQHDYDSSMYIYTDKKQEWIHVCMSAGQIKFYTDIFKR